MDVALKRAQRGHKLQRKLKQVAELECARIARVRRDLQQQQVELIRRLDGEHVLHGLFVANVNENLRRLSRQLDALCKQERAASRAYADASVRSKCSEGILNCETERDLRNQEEDRLFEIIETRLSGARPT